MAENEEEIKSLLLKVKEKKVSQFSYSVVSGSFPHHGLQHSRSPCPSPAPRIYPNSCPLSCGCYPITSFCCPFLLQPSIFPSIRVFSNESVLHIRWPKYWSGGLVFPSLEQLFTVYCDPQSPRLWHSQ